MSDKDINRLLMEYAEFAIKTKFKGQPTGYVSANLLLYYDPTDDRKCVSPDTFYVRDAKPGLRDTYKLWKERFVPDVVFEFVAKASWRVDPEVKRDIYERLGVPEYYVFDPLRRWIDPPLWAYRLEAGRYRAIPVVGGEIDSPCLGMRMRVEGEWLRFYDSVTEEAFLTADEMEERARREAERATLEAERARVEAERADAATRRAEQETERARALEAEVERLRRELGHHE